MGRTTPRHSYLETQAPHSLEGLCEIEHTYLFGMVGAEIKKDG